MNEINATGQKTVLLASGSPRRRELLALLGITYKVAAADIDETALSNELPSEMVIRLAMSKALAAGGGGALVIGADTTVVLGQRVLGKPADAAAALIMLRELRGREHYVYTGLALVEHTDGVLCSALACTPVEMREYSEGEIAAYVASGDPLDKAGSYAIQHPGFQPVKRINGCYANVVGLPLCHLYQALMLFGIQEAAHPLDCCPWAVPNGCKWAKAILETPLSALPLQSPI